MERSYLQQAVDTQPGLQIGRMDRIKNGTSIKFAFQTKTYLTEVDTGKRHPHYAYDTEFPQTVTYRNRKKVRNVVEVLGLASDEYEIKTIKSEQDGYASIRLIVRDEQEQPAEETVDVDQPDQPVDSAIVHTMEESVQSELATA